MQIWNVNRKKNRNLMVVTKTLVKNGRHECSLFKGVICLVIGILLICNLFLAVGEASAQDRNIAKNSFYIEFLGNGLFYTINYERAFNQFLRGRIGVKSHIKLYVR